MLHHSWMHKVRAPARTYTVANSNNEDDDQLLRDVRVYALAEYFDVAALKSHALQIFKAKVRDLWVSESFVDCIRETGRREALGTSFRIPGPGHHLEQPRQWLLPKTSR